MFVNQIEILLTSLEANDSINILCDVFLSLEKCARFVYVCVCVSVCCFTFSWYYIMVERCQMCMASARFSLLNKCWIFGVRAVASIKAVDFANKCVVKVEREKAGKKAHRVDCETNKSNIHIHVPLVQCAH